MAEKEARGRRREQGLASDGDESSNEEGDDDEDDNMDEDNEEEAHDDDGGDGLCTRGDDDKKPPASEQIIAFLAPNASNTHMFCKLICLGSKKKKPAVTPDRDRRAESVRELLEKASVSTEDMVALPHHTHMWREATADDSVSDFGNARQHRLATDILLCGPTSLNQVKVGIPKEDTLTVEIKLPSTCFSARRTAVKTADIAGIAASQIGRVIDRAHAMSRVSSHRDKLEELRKTNNEGKITFDVKLPAPVEGFTRRDDFGNPTNVAAIQIATCQHEDPVMQAAGQFVWILHVEMLGKEKPQTGMSSPGAFGNCHDCA